MTHPDRVPVVGIGASAGGVEALQALFRAMPDPPPGAALVVVTHLGSGHDSALPSILAGCTAMPVVAAEDGAVLAPGRAYVLAHDAVLTVAAGQLRLRPQAQAARRERQPIDVFLASLAEDLGEFAFGIVPSGSGSDGTLGLKAIKERGGVTLAQGSDGTAPRYPDMPSSAIAGGGVDLVLSVEEMPARLVELVQGLAPPDVGADAAAPAADQDAAVQDAISTILRERTGHDFAGYKAKTFFRRVQRRRQVLRLGDIPAYVDRLRDDTAEAGCLFRDLLIGVTGFFRDPKAFAALEERVIPAPFQGRSPEETVRVWVPGCATGEEAYSLAMLPREFIDAHPGSARAHVFATDIDEAALGVARAGRYPAPMVAGVSPARLARHFVTDGASHAMVRELRELCIFSPHSVIRDAPFSRIDLVSCRNLLIYMGGQLQEQVMPTFHYALRPGGYLFLGIAETIARHADLFVADDLAHRIYRRRLHGATPAIPLRLQPVPRSAPQAWPPPLPPMRVSPFGADARRTAEALVLDRFAPAHVLVDHEGDIVHQSARLGKYLELAAGTPTRQLLSMARRGLRPALRSALREAVSTGREAARPRIEVEFEGHTQQIALTVTPVPARAQERLFVVVFVDLGALRLAEPMARGAEPPPQDGSVIQLEFELRETRERLQSTIEEYETTAEELKSANEALISVNEELQSINEELETSKEELQSVNEELRTTNMELAGKNDSLDRANADLRNLFASTQVVTILLDRHLVIRGFTPAIASIFNLVATDVGRPLSAFASRLDRVDLRQETLTVLAGRAVIERRVTAQDGSIHYLMRVQPYRAEGGEVDGVVVTLFDVTKVVEGEVLETLVNELNHRVRNMLQVVQAVGAHTLRHAPSLETFGKSFLGRVRALARAHELVALGHWHNVSLRDLLEKELEPYCGGAAERLTVTGAPAPPPPQDQSGFGSKLIDQQLRHDLRGSIAVEFAAAGLRAELLLPASILVPTQVALPRG